MIRMEKFINDKWVKKQLLILQVSSNSSTSEPEPLNTALMSLSSTSSIMSIKKTYTGYSGHEQAKRYAEICKRYRERKKRNDPDYMRREAERRRIQRKNEKQKIIDGKISEEELIRRKKLMRERSLRYREKKAEREKSNTTENQEDPKPKIKKKRRKPPKIRKVPLRDHAYPKNCNFYGNRDRVLQYQKMKAELDKSKKLDNQETPETKSRRKSCIKLREEKANLTITIEEKCPVKRQKKSAKKPTKNTCAKKGNAKT